MNQKESLENQKISLLGDEAVALGAIHSGIHLAVAYPGTPSTEILEYIRAYADSYREKDIQAYWATNEKTSLEQALGVSLNGGRALVSMKHVGLNVAADPFFSGSLAKLNGGLVVAIADDPGMHSSQNEQDSRYLCSAAGIPYLEPSDIQEAYDMTKEAFELSERYHVPFVVRLTTRIAHQEAVVKTSSSLDKRILDEKTLAERGSHTLLPAISRKLYDYNVNIKREKLKEEFQNSKFNELVLSEKAKTGIISTGNAHNYFKEVVKGHEKDFSYLKIGTFPLPEAKILELAKTVDRIVIIEDGNPFLEEEVYKILGKNKISGENKVSGKLTKDLPNTGELDPMLVRSALYIEPPETASISVDENLIVNRPPRLCDNCSHYYMYEALRSAKKKFEDKEIKTFIYGDIGCYTLGFASGGIDSVINMGASIGMALGGALSNPEVNHVAVIGDSTFAHSGIPGLLDTASLNADLTIIIADNNITAMTGHQPQPLSGVRLYNIIKAAGVDESHIRKINAKKGQLKENTKILLEEMKYKGLSVVIAEGVCVQNKRRKHSFNPKLVKNNEILDHFDLEKRIVFAGVGGQGVITASGIVYEAALSQGLNAKKGEVHGMSQRGGIVDSHLVYSQNAVYSSLLSEGMADLIIGLEPLEALRHYRLLKPDGKIITNTAVISNIDYDSKRVIETLKRFPNTILLDADSFAKKAKFPKANNMVMLGASASYLGLDKSVIKEIIKARFKDKSKLMDSNLKAFELGLNSAQK